MRICGVTAEYNPFHEGHEYHIAEAKRQSGADALVVIMSGHFVQRGEPAVFNPYRRAEDALKAGADAVFMMPPEASTSSAEGFAAYGVGLLDKLGCDAISCGTEPETDADKLAEYAKLLCEESSDVSDRIKTLLKSGISYPAAVTEAFGIEKLGPNALLALEYLKALYKTESKMEFVPVTRKGSGYADREINPGMYPSATALRAALLSDENCREMPLGPDDFMPEIINSIQRTDNLQEYLDCDEAIAARLKKSDFHYNSFEEMVKDIKTREYTYTRIARAIIHIYLQIKKPAKEIKSAYLIGFKSPELLTELKNRSQLQIISKAADYREELESTARAAELYNTVLWKKYKVEYPNIYQQKIIKCS